MQDDLFKRIAVPWILDAEGGFVNEASDRGGATKYGISIKFLRLLPDHDGDGFVDGDLDRDGDVDIEDIQGLDVEDAIDLYHQYFWLSYKCAAFNNPAIALCLFDAVVNHRPKTAKILLQRGLGVTADGDIGPRTMRAAQEINADIFLPLYFSFRAKLFHDIVKRHSDQDVYFRGWLRRLFLLQQYIYLEI